ncbi:MAG TPA: PLP-dependent aminotransferase family protein [Chthoniobacterales bacterium]
MILSWVRQHALAADGSEPRYKAIAEVIAHGIKAGQIPTGRRLPTVRELAKSLGVSDTTIAAAYRLLRQQGQVEGRVGSGTYVIQEPDRTRANQASPPMYRAGVDRERSMAWSPPWRRRTLTAHAGHLRAAFPAALDCTSGRPDPALFPLAQLQRAWRFAIDQMTYDGLQYAGPYPIAPLAKQVVLGLEREGVVVKESDIAVGSSAQQLIMLSLRVISTVLGKVKLTVAVEEPGYATIFDSLGRLGHRLVGMKMDDQGALPASLEEALASGANVVLLTPRAHNPTGASWSLERKAALAEILARHPGATAIEDDYFAGATTSRPGSLLTDERLEDRVIYIRSFSKSVAPDFRLAVASVRPRLRALLMEEKSFADGWSSHLAQFAMATLLADPEVKDILATAAQAYADRRRAATSSLLSESGGLARVASAGDGVNVWINLSPEVHPSEAIEQAAALGVLIAPGEPFFLDMGHNNAVRFNAGSAKSVDQAFEIGRILSRAIIQAAEDSSGSFLIPHV